MLIKLENGQPTGHPVTEENFRKLFPDVSFPNPMTVGDVDQFGFGIYQYCQIPEPGVYEKVIEVSPTKNQETGVWMQTWKLVPMTPEEIEEKNILLKSEVKLQAMSRLAATDWIELPSVTDTTKARYLLNKHEFDDYRFALREIAINPPISITNWPTKPDAVWSN